MTPEWLAAIVAIVAAFVAGGGAIVAYSQAISAKRQAESSEKSAAAAVEQVAIARAAAGSAAVQAAEAKRGNDLAGRVATGDAISALDAYTAAISAMTQAGAAVHYGHAIPSNDRRQLIRGAQARRSEIMALLTTRELMRRWMAFEADFDSFSLHLAAKEEGGPTSDATLIRLSTPRQIGEIDALEIMASLWFTIMDLRKHLDGQAHATLP
jgi:hypothetical protein